MEKVRDVAVLVGSLRKESFTRKVALAMKGLAPTSLALNFVEIRDLQMYDEDLETETPPREWVSFRDRIRRADALLFATPEYNRSVPGCLKNSVDVGSRPGGHGVFSGKPGAIVSVAPYGTRVAFPSSLSLSSRISSDAARPAPRANSIVRSGRSTSKITPFS
jgi:chromate reductase